mmetsp:Transcript_17435/g.26145  ORF Transcript_17435/g.26145 Transcript_17435/m.26145 type:complete len:110 (+) Transcript_17435:412-741(+)
MNWKISQAALEGRDIARRSVMSSGEKDPMEAPNDSVKQWIWGRGLRWPFHYLIILALAQPLIFPDPPLDVQGTKERASLGKAKASKQIVIGLSILALYNYVLLNFGLDY